MKAELERREKRNAAYKETLKKREKKDLSFSDNGNNWTADMPEKYQEKPEHV